ncbi:MAG: alpha/beta fold hydrolase [Phycisphaerales bacterium]|nr:alpha/beta fold hydrolase [Phycisphaerales bacterium]
MRRKRRFLVLATFVACCGCCGLWFASRRGLAVDPEPAAQKGVTVVVLVHGLGRTSASMAPLGDRLASVGFDVRKWDYPSTQETIESHSARLAEFVRKLDADPGIDRIHFVTHSLGGIVVRRTLMDERPAKMGRVVMLAPPNGGSATARFWAPLAGQLIKPLKELSDASDSVVNQMGAPRDVEIGVIAAAKDGKVALADTHLKGEADHLIVPGYHSFIMCRPEVAEQTIHFFRTGRFDHDAPSEAEADARS